MSLTTTLWQLLVTVLFLFPLFVYRLKSVTDPKRSKPQRNGRQNPKEPTHLLVVLGSGGHTAEMIAMLQRAVSQKDAGARVNWSDFSHRTWVVGSGDTISADRARDFEQLAAQDNSGDPGTYDVQVVPRARGIHQPLYTAPVSSLRCLLACIGILAQKKFPDLILCNGPATATIVVFTSILLRFFNIRGCNSKGKMRTIYIESFARVKRLSLSGKLLVWVADRFLVQWPQLSGGRAEYIGVLV